MCRPLLVYFEDSETEVVEPLSVERRVQSTLGTTQFTGEVAPLRRGNWSMPMRASRDTRALVVPGVVLLAG